MRQITSELVLFHGSRNGLSGAVSHAASRGRTQGATNYLDFGPGFYAGSYRNSALEWVLEQQPRKATVSSIVISDKNNFETRGLKVHRFTTAPDDLNTWILFVAYNRGWFDKTAYDGSSEYDPRSRFPMTCELMESLNNNDLIIGPIADDQMSETYSLFLRGYISINEVAACLRVIDLGTQYAFKTKEACAFLNDRSFVRIQTQSLDSMLRSLNLDRIRLLANKRKKYKNMPHLLDNIHRSFENQREAKKFWQILEEREEQEKLRISDSQKL